MPLNAESSFKEQREIHGAKCIGGQEVLVVIVSRTGDFGMAVDRYCELLQDTYGEGHVKIVGAGRPTYKDRASVPEAEREYTDKKLIGWKHLKQEQFMKLINAEHEQGNVYDQIHIVGHGSPTKGLTFSEGRDVYTGRLITVTFDDATAAEDIASTSQWPWKPGVRILLVGCDTDAGPLKSFIEGSGIASDVYVWEGEFKCFGKFPEWEYPDGSIKRGERIVYRWDSPLQHEAVRDIGRYLKIIE